jgi:hypothetical protein
MRTAATAERLGRDVLLGYAQEATTRQAAVCVDGIFNPVIHKRLS